METETASTQIAGVFFVTELEVVEPRQAAASVPRLVSQTLLADARDVPRTDSAAPMLLSRDWSQIETMMSSATNQEADGW